MANRKEEPFDRDRYIISREIVSRHGGQGKIFDAIDTRFKRRVLIKQLHPGLATSSSGRARFKREADTTAALQHPGIVPVHDFFENADGLPCCVMEFVFDETENGTVRAESLDELLARRTEINPSRTDANLRKLVGILVDVADTVAYAHRQGIIHRDLKCSNILSSRQRTIVLDWGVLKIDGEYDEDEDINENLPEKDRGMR